MQRSELLNKLSPEVFSISDTCGKLKEKTTAHFKRWNDYVEELPNRQKIKAFGWILFGVMFCSLASATAVEMDKPFYVAVAWFGISLILSVLLKYLEMHIGRPDFEKKEEITTEKKND